MDFKIRLWVEEKTESCNKSAGFRIVILQVAGGGLGRDVTLGKHSYTRDRRALGELIKMKTHTHTHK